MAAKSYPSWHYFAAGIVLVLMGVTGLALEDGPSRSTSLVVQTSFYLLLGGMALGAGVYQVRRRRTKSA